MRNVSVDFVIYGIWCTWVVKVTERKLADTGPPSDLPSGLSKALLRTSFARLPTLAELSVQDELML
jgi:hypothetical protein